MAPRRYISPEKGAEVLGVSASRWRQIRSERPDSFPDHAVEVGDPSDLDNPKRRIKRGYDREHVETFRRHLKEHGPPPPRRGGTPMRYVSARVAADQLGLSLTRIAQLVEDASNNFPRPAVIIDNPDGETYGWDLTAIQAYRAHREQHPPRAGRPYLTEASREEAPDDPAV